QSQNCRDHESDSVHLTLRGPRARLSSKNHAATPGGGTAWKKGLAFHRRTAEGLSFGYRVRIVKISALEPALPCSPFAPPATRMRPSPRLVQVAQARPSAIMLRSAESPTKLRSTIFLSLFQTSTSAVLMALCIGSMPPVTRRRFSSIATTQAP